MDGKTVFCRHFRSSTIGEKTMDKDSTPSPSDDITSVEMGLPLPEMIRRLNAIHAAKNARERMFTMPIGCLLFIAAALKAINDEVTKRDGRRIASLLPNFLKRLFTLVSLWGTEPFLEVLRAKYPASGCGYCHALPCRCGSTKAAPWKQETSIALGSDQLSWSISDWQSHHLLVYGAKNTCLPVDRLLVWQGDEFLETFIAIGYMEYAKAYDLPVEEAMKALASELPDLFMRALALANHYVIDAETFLVQRYQHGCVKCRQLSCVCPSSLHDFGLFERETLAATRPAKE